MFYKYQCRNDVGPAGPQNRCIFQIKKWIVSWFKHYIIFAIFILCESVLNNKLIFNHFSPVNTLNFILQNTNLSAAIINWLVVLLLTISAELFNFQFQNTCWWNGSQGGGEAEYSFAIFEFWWSDLTIISKKRKDQKS